MCTYLLLFFKKKQNKKKIKKKGGRCKYARNIQHEKAILGPEQKAERCNVVMAHHAILEELQSAVRIWRTSFRASTLWSSQQSTGWGGAAMSHTDAAFSGLFLSGSWRTNIHTDKSTVLCVLDWNLSLSEYRIHSNFRTCVLMWSKNYLLVSLSSIYKLVFLYEIGFGLSKPTEDISL